MLVVIFGYTKGIDFMKKKLKKYFDHFFELAKLSVQVRINILRIFYHFSNQIGESFDTICECAE